MKGNPIKIVIKTPSSADSFTVEGEDTPAHFDFPIVRVSAGEHRVALTPTAAGNPGQALFEAGYQRQ